MSLCSRSPSTIHSQRAGPEGWSAPRPPAPQRPHPGPSPALQRDKPMWPGPRLSNSHQPAAQRRATRPWCLTPRGKCGALKVPSEPEPEKFTSLNLKTSSEPQKKQVGWHWSWVSLSRCLIDTTYHPTAFFTNTTTGPRPCQQIR